MKYVEELGIYVTKVEDLRDKVSPDLYETVEHLVNEDSEVQELRDNYEALQDEFRSYAFSCEEMRNLLLDVSDSITDIGKQLDAMYEYVFGAKRINRDTLGKQILDIKLGRIKRDINKIL